MKIPAFNNPTKLCFFFGLYEQYQLSAVTVVDVTETLLKILSTDTL